MKRNERIAVNFCPRDSYMRDGENLVACLVAEACKKECPFGEYKPGNVAGTVSTKDSDTPWGYCPRDEKMEDGITRQGDIRWCPDIGLSYCKKFKGECNLRDS